MMKELRQQYISSIAVPSFQSSEDYYINIIRNGLGFLQEYQQLIQAIDADSILNIIAHSTGTALRNELLLHLEADQRFGYVLVATPEITAELFIGSINQISRWLIKNPNKISMESLLKELVSYVHRLVYREDKRV
ncbi:MAG: hypothetical protein Q4B70_05130 [Lachnospiraceae bacterium]|nr:hypothetical protein [Lachnospiraceae bacterium]